MMPLRRFQKRLMDPAIRLPVRVVSALCVLVLSIVASADAQKRRKIPVPEEIIEQLSKRLSKSEFYKECFDERGGAAKTLEGEPLELCKRGSEILVTGASCLCGATGSCPGWIYRKTANGYEVIMDAGSLQALEYGKAFTKGYRDIMISDKKMQFDDYLYLYKFDGKKYQVKECFERRNTRGGVTGKMLPKTVRVTCGRRARRLWR